jgi:hypothetical protein
MDNNYIIIRQADSLQPIVVSTPCQSSRSVELSPYPTPHETLRGSHNSCTASASSCDTDLYCILTFPMVFLACLYHFCAPRLKYRPYIYSTARISLDSVRLEIEGKYNYATTKKSTAA